MDRIHEQSIEEEAWYKGPIKTIVGLFLLLIIIIMIVPQYGLKLDPHPKNVDVKLIFLNDTYSKFDTFDSLKSLTVSGTIRNSAVAISSANCKNSNVCNAKALFYFVRDKIDYVPDPSREYIQHPIETLHSGGGDCEDKNLALANLLQAIGVRTRLVLTTNHAYMQAWMPEAFNKYKTEFDWINLDTACSYCEFGQIPAKYSNSPKKYIDFS